jgi:L-alanine-DL-glutamate epimerase-like enolase superfamily enzyme
VIAADSSAMAGYDRLATLPLEIDGYDLTPHALVLSPQFTRHTTVVRLCGGGEQGVGEDTTYAPPDQLAFQRAGAVQPLAGSWTLDAFSAHLAGLDLFPDGASHDEFRRFRRWAFESAALDLALRQSGRSLPELLARVPRPLRFVVSPGPESSAAPLQARLARYPGLRFKLMPAVGWNASVIADLAATGAVDVVDLKGQYDESVPIAWPADPELYRQVATGLPDALIEDPAWTPETESVLAAHRDRITWDAPIRSVADIGRLPFKPRMLNVKPSRFGSVRALLAFYDHCEQAGIGLYGGGQFELGPGRHQIQLLASLFHPDAPNDVAPGAYNAPVLQAGLPQSPLPAPPAGVGFA